MNLRPMTDADYPALVMLHNLCRPEAPVNEEELRFTDGAFGKGDVLTRHLLEGRCAPRQDPCLLGASLLATEHAGVRQFRIDLLVHPENDLEGLGQRLYRFVAHELERYEPTALVTRVREDEAWLPFYRERGFDELERMWESRLDVEHFDPAPFSWAPERAERAGISFMTLADLADSESTQRLLYATIVELLQDVPNREALNIWRFDTWRERYWHNPARNPRSFFLAFDGDTLVGMSELRKSERPGHLLTGLTGVRRNWRRKGIAQALKLWAVRYARDSAAKVISTQNHSVNRPMLAINEAMGFVKQPAWIRLKKSLCEECT